jgi:hypothetical protein
MTVAPSSTWHWKGLPFTFEHKVLGRATLTTAGRLECTRVHVELVCLQHYYYLKNTYKMPSPSESMGE